MSFFNDNNTQMGYIGNPRLSLCKFSVKGFKLEHLAAGIYNDYIVITGSHGEKSDEYSLVSRTFTRRVAIPRDIIEDEIKIQLFSNSFLSVSGKKRIGVLEIPIQQINIPALTQKTKQLTRRQLNRQNLTLFNPGYLSFLKIFRKSSQPFDDVCNRCVNQKSIKPIKHRKKTMLDRHFKMHCKKN